MGSVTASGPTWFEMQVSKNDLPERTGKQNAMLIPVDGRFLFPALPDRTGSHWCFVDVQVDGMPIAMRYALHTSKNESHLSQGTDDLARAWGLKIGSVIRFERTEGGSLMVSPVSRNDSTERAPVAASGKPFSEIVADMQALVDSARGFDPSGIEDARRRIAREIAYRLGQPKFRKALVDAYGGTCAMSGCREPAALEAAHIHPYLGAASHSVNNGLLLRADFHALFDRGLVTVDADAGFKVRVSTSLISDHYSGFEGVPIKVPRGVGQRPSSSALRWHLDNVFIP